MNESGWRTLQLLLLVAALCTESHDWGPATDDQCAGDQCADDAALLQLVQAKAAELRLVKRGASCNCSSSHVGRYQTPEQCAVVVRSVGGKFFAFGNQSTATNDCRQKYPSAPICPEGYVPEDADYYNIPDVPFGDALYNQVATLKATLISERNSSGLLPQDTSPSAPEVIAIRKGWTAPTPAPGGEPVLAFCHSRYKLELSAGYPVVREYVACCNNSRACYAPELPTTVQTVGHLTSRGASWMTCGTKNDVYFWAGPRAVPPLPDATLDSCIKLEVMSTISTFHAMLDACPTALKLGLRLAANGLFASYKLQAAVSPGSEGNGFAARLVGKLPGTSVMDPVTFDLFSLAATAFFVHFRARLTYNQTLPASERIGLPYRTEFLDRVTVFNSVTGAMTETDPWARDFYWDLPQACISAVLLGFPLEDGLLDGTNNWDRALKEPYCPGNLSSCTRKEFHMGIYAGYTIDGLPLYPAETIDFAGMFYRSGEWLDTAETFVAWNNIGAHRLEPVPPDSPEAKGGARFMLLTSVLGSIAMRPGFARFGADMFFNGAMEPTMVRTPDGKEVWRAEVAASTWQYWKFVWRSSTVLLVTAVDHLTATHHAAATAVAAASRETVAPSRPLRRLLTMLSWGSIWVNAGAVAFLNSPLGLLHRSTGWESMDEANAAATAMLPPLSKQLGIFVDAAQREALPPEMHQIPYVQDGQLLFDNLRGWMQEWFEAYGWCEDGRVRDHELRLFASRLWHWSLYAPHKETDATTFGLYTSDGGLNCSGVQTWLSALAFQVTGYHRHVGYVADAVSDPDFVSPAFKPGEAFGLPRQHLQLALNAATTGVRYPKLSEDYTFLANGVDMHEQARSLFRSWHVRMQDQAKEIDRRNTARPVAYREMHPDEVECSVAV